MRKGLLIGVGFVSLLLLMLAAPPPAPAAVSVSGFVQTHIIYSDKIHGTVAPLRSGVAAVPLDTDKDRDNPQFSLDALQTRVRVTWTDDVGGVKMSGSVETDFATGDGTALTSNSRHLRLRLAYARADHPSGFFLQAGQYWTLIYNEDIAFLGKYGIDAFNPGAATLGAARQPNIKVGWKSALAPGMGNLTLEGGIEKHSVQNLGSAVVDESQGEGQPTPLVAGRVTWDHPIVRLQAAAAFAENTVILAGGKDESDTAWAFVASTEVKFPPVTLFGHVNTQKGLGRLMNAEFISAACSPAPFNCSVAGSKVENIESTGFYAGVAYNLTPTTQLDAWYGWRKADEVTSAGFTGAALEKHQSISVNVRQRFWQNWLAGIEYRHYWVEAFNGTEGDVNHIAGTILYFF